MGTVIAIDYSDLDSAQSNAKKAADQCESYVQEIEKKISNKLSSVTMGSNGNTSNADYYAKCKIRELNAKKVKYNSFASKVENAVKYAKDVDKNVQKYIKRESVSFRNTHDMKTNVIEDFFAWITTKLLNSTDFGRWLQQRMRDVSTWLDEAKRKFKEWYHLEGGKYIIKTVIAVVGVVIAAIVLVCVAWPALLGASTIWAAIVAGAGVATAVMAVVDGTVSLIANATAAVTFADDPGWAKRYSSMKTLSDYLRKTNFKCDWLNKWSGTLAGIYDGIAIAATIINVADICRTGYKFILSIKEKGGLWKVFDKVRFKTPDGKMTFGTFKHGLKRLVSNFKVIKDGFTTTNYSRITKAAKDGLGSIFKGFETGKKIIENIDDFGDKGELKFSIDKLKELVREKTVVGEFVKDVYDTGKDVYDKTNITINPAKAY